jgi:hypothetical protein
VVCGKAAVGKSPRQQGDIGKLMLQPLLQRYQSICHLL